MTTFYVTTVAMGKEAQSDAPPTTFDTIRLTDIIAGTAI